MILCLQFPRKITSPILRSRSKLIATCNGFLSYVSSGLRNPYLKYKNQGTLMSISVIIPLYNGAPWIEETIESVLNQELQPNEIIVVDDGSTDASMDLAQKYHGVTLLKNIGKGSSDARNLGIQKTNSTFLAFLDQDDVWHPKHLKGLYQIINQNPKVNTVFSEASCFENKPEYNLSSDKYEFFDPWTNFPFTVGVDGPSLSIIRRSAIDIVGMWDQEGTGMGDVLLFLKLSAIYPLLKTNNCTVGKRIHPFQQWLKVRERPLEYLDFRYKVSALALNFLKNNSCVITNHSIYDDRLKALKILRNITEAILEDNFKSIVHLASELEEDLLVENNKILKHTFYCLMGALFPTNNIQELKNARDAAFSKLSEIWPNTAKRTKKAMLELIDEVPRIS